MTQLPFAVSSVRRSLLCLVCVVACSLVPTDPVCGCPPSRSHFVVAGRVRGAGDVPVIGARIEFSGMPLSRDTMGSASVILSDARVITDSGGGFRARVFSIWSPELHTLRMRVIRVTPTDTTTVAVGSVRFVFEGDRPDSTFVSVRLP